MNSRALECELENRMYDKHANSWISMYLKRGGGWKNANVKTFTTRVVLRRPVRDSSGNLVKLRNGKQKFLRIGRRKWKKEYKNPRAASFSQMDTEFINDHSHAVYASTVKRLMSLSRSGDLQTYSGRQFTLATMTPDDIEGVYNKPFAPDSALHGEGMFPAVDLTGAKTTKDRKDARDLAYTNAIRQGHRLFSTTLKRIYICREMIKADNACCRRAFVVTAAVVAVIATATVVATASSIM